MPAEIPDGAFIVARAIFNSSVWTMPNTDRILAITLIGLANWRDKSWFDGKRDIIIKRGQLVRGIRKLAKEAGLSYQETRTSITHLENIGFLTQEVTGPYTIITLPKYHKYQDLTKYADTEWPAELTQDLTRGQRTPNARLTRGQREPNDKQESYIQDESEKGEKQDIAANAAHPSGAITQDLVDLWNHGKSKSEWIRVTPKRTAKTASRLKEGFTREQLITAVGNCLKSEWHQGANDRGWKAPGPEWVLHSTEKTEEWIKKVPVVIESMTDLIRKASNGQT